MYRATFLSNVEASFGFNGLIYTGNLISNFCLSSNSDSCSHFIYVMKWSYITFISFVFKEMPFFAVTNILVTVGMLNMSLLGRYEINSK